MKKISVYVKNKNTLVLNEDGIKGDYIDLTDLTSVDTTAILEAISAEKDRVYSAKLEEFKKALTVEAKLEKEQAEAKLLSKIQELEAVIQKNKELGESNLKAKDKEKVDALRLKESELDNKYQGMINELQEKIATFEANKNSEITSINAKYKEELNEKEQAIKTYQVKLDQVTLTHKQELKNKELEVESKYKDEIAGLKKEAEVEKVNNQNAISKLTFEHQKALDDTKHQYDDKIRTLNDTVLGLQRQRAQLGSKLIGEDLEVWCTNEYLSFAQTGGLSNCVWTKDNQVVRYADQVKGSKGDFILNCYANDSHNEEELLTSILFEMKNESPESKSKQHNSDFYAKLDENRNKKHCKYAVLVSDLDRGNNDLPMSRVLDYPDMYQVRPEYLMTFINIITSLTRKFVDLVLDKNKEELTLKTKKQILEDFDDIKNSYLDKELNSLAKDIDEIEKQTDIIINSANKINATIEHTRLQYIQKIERKLEIYTAKLTKTLNCIEE